MLWDIKLKLNRCLKGIAFPFSRSSDHIKFDFYDYSAFYKIYKAICLYEFQ